VVLGPPFLAKMPPGRWASEDDIAAPIVFLLSDAAAMIAGVSLPIDGGIPVAEDRARPASAPANVTEQCHR